MPKLKVGVIGLGAISHENILGYLDSPDATVTAVCDPDEQRGIQWLEKYGLTDAGDYTEHAQMLAHEDLDVVEILTPHHLHCEHAIAAAEAKVRGISLQKPMAVTLQECDRIIDACNRNGVVLKVYENFLFYPVYLKAKELIEDGLIGEPVSIRVNTMVGVSESAEWPWCFHPNSWRADLSACGTGPLVGDDGFHKFSLVRWFMGRDLEKISAWIDPQTPLDAPAYIRAKFRQDPSEWPKYAQIDFTFLPKMSLPCDFWLDDFVEIVGERGVMWINQCSAAGDRELFRGIEMSSSRVFPPIVVFVDGKVTTYLEDMSPSQRNWSTSFIGSTRHFIEVLINGGEPIYTGEDGKETTRCAIAAFVSAQENRDVALDEITSEAEGAGRFALRTNFCNLE
jgi:predicted dehydrogenase